MYIQITVSSRKTLNTYLILIYDLEHLDKCLEISHIAYLKLTDKIEIPQK